MFIKQISVFIENKSGRLAEITEVLAAAKINIHAISIADTTDFGILRIIVDNPSLAKASLKEKGMTAKITEVLGITVSHEPGGLAKVLRTLTEEKIAVEYMYDFTSHNTQNRAVIILRLDKQEEAVEVLKKNNIPIVTPEDITI